VTFDLIVALVNATTVVMTTIGLPGLFALMAISVFGFSPIPTEVILPFAGFLVFDGTFSFPWAMVAAMAGTMVGAYAGYAVGLWWRDRITGIGIGHLRIAPKHLEQVDRFFAQHGEAAVALFRMVPVIRSYISYPAGTARMEPVRFGVYTFLGSLPYTAAFVVAGMVLRSNWVLLTGYFQILDIPILLLVVAIVVVLALQVAGVLEPGWPLRRARAPAMEAELGAPPPENGPPPS
jgi:membrane protein DedA with SNARE-associated domain